MSRKKLIVPLIVFLIAMFISACENSSEQNGTGDSDKDKITDEKDNSSNVPNKDNKKEESSLDETDKETEKNTKDIIEKPEYSSFEEYVSSSAKDFNGESEMWDVSTDEQDIKVHLVRTTGLYLKHFKALEEVPDDLQGLVNEGIEISSPFEDLFVEHNRDEVDKSFNQLKSIYNQLEKKIQKQD